MTAPFTVSFGNVTATAYCIQPSKPGPGSGTYQITKLEGNRELAKVCYYGTEAAGSAYFFNHYHTDFSAGKRFIVTHLAASYANGSAPIFLPAKGLLLPIWQPPMPMEAKMPSMEPTVPGKRWQRNFITML